ncbi:MAG: ParB/RepB/Spo0J family partition protein [Rhizobiaceae bacterium]
MATLPIENIRHRQDARHRDEAALNALAESMDEIGLINPIRVREVGDGLYEVVAGSHRLQAAELLEWPTILAFVAFDDDLHAELAMIDENLVRAELSVVDRARQTARRKAIYLLLHPESGHGSPGVARQVGDTGQRSDVERFTANTAAATGHSERVVQRDAERGEKIVDEALDAVRGTQLDRGVYLDRLKNVPAEQQADTVRRDLAAGRATANSAAQNNVARRYQATPPSELFERFCAAANALEAIDVKAVIEGAGRQRSVVGQRASGIIEIMEQLLEGLS